MDVLEGAGLIAAAGSAGVVNAVAGGGSLISFPALLAAGYPAKTANVTNTVALWPGTVGGSFGYRAELMRQRSRLTALLLPSLAGSLIGSVVLLATPESAFDAIVPFLLIFACLIMAFQDQLAAFAFRHQLGSPDGIAVPFLLKLFIFVLAIYGAYFGAGFSIIALAFLAILIRDDIQHLNALKGMLALLVNALAVVYFAFFGPVEWGPALLMAVAALIGGYLGAGLARRLSRRLLRFVVISYGTLVAVVLLVN
ncbi:MAG TPA: sulfite exporter TauE/SafE family protein [Dehalococcoidia bacterium]|nr:sulfite exporter TauE/SafE family protein [Dehalococcoidia bacterium]